MVEGCEEVEGAETIGERKKTKSSTQFLAGPMLHDHIIAIMASAMHPKAKPVLAAPKGVA